VPGRPTCGTAVDLGGIAKGYAVDLAARALREAGVEDFIVDAGGDLFVAGDKNGKPWRVGIQDPRDPAKLFRIVTPAEGSLVTSGDYERYFLWEGRRYHHILDPRTGFPAPNCRSVTIFAPTSMDADAAATTVFVLGPEAGIKFLEGQKGFAGLIIDAAGGVRETFNFSTVVPTVSGSSAGGGT
jgi:thiamine biosynthesis lipoprotein